MSKIKKHPVLEVPVRDRVIFKYNGQEVEGEKGYTIAAALHRAGFPVHSHSLDGRERSLECGIGKCGACEMLVDGKIRRICITKVDGVKEVREVTEDFIDDLPNNIAGAKACGMDGYCFADGDVEKLKRTLYESVLS